MWQPKYEEIKLKALKALRMMNSGEYEVSDIAKEFGNSEKTIYRYLNWAGYKFPPRKRDKSGRFK